MADEEAERWAADPEKAFEEGVWTCLNLWDTLMLAVGNGWGGGNPDDKMDALYNDALAIFDEAREKGQRVYPEMVQPLLAESIEKDFNVDAQDGSPEFVARRVCQLRLDCEAGDFEGLAKLTRRLEKINGRPIGAGISEVAGGAEEFDGPPADGLEEVAEADEREQEEEEDDDDDDDEVEEEENKADDGWDVVGSNVRGGGKAKKARAKKAKAKARAAAATAEAETGAALAVETTATVPAAEPAAGAAAPSAAAAPGQGKKKKEKKKKGGAGMISV